MPLHLEKKTIKKLRAHFSSHDKPIVHNHSQSEYQNGDILFTARFFKSESTLTERNLLSGVIHGPVYVYAHKFLYSKVLKLYYNNVKLSQPKL